MKTTYVLFIILLGLIGSFSIAIIKYKATLDYRPVLTDSYSPITIMDNNNISTQDKSSETVITDTHKPKILWGAYTGNSMESLEEFEKIIGKKPDINAFFIDLRDSFPFRLASYLGNNNQIMLLYLEQNDISLDDVISGKYDSSIKQLSIDIKNNAKQVILAPLHEMNGNWNSLNGTAGNNKPDKVIAEWRHIYDIFSENNVDNVKWAFVVNNESVPDIPANDMGVYYPGDAYVDYVGVDGFNFGNPWQSYDELFLNALNKLSIYNKPMYIFSFASAQGPQKSVWIQDALSKIYSDKRIKGWVWFNENKEEDWRIWSDENSLQSFQSFIR